MPTITLYPKKAWIVDQYNPLQTYPQSRLTDLETALLIMDASFDFELRGEKSVIYEFDVPQNLYGKQVTSGYAQLTLTGWPVELYPIDGLHTPTALESETITFSKLHTRFDHRHATIEATAMGKISGDIPYTITYHAGESSNTDKTLEAECGLLARMLNGLVVRNNVSPINDTGWRKSVIKSAPTITITYSDTPHPSIKQHPVSRFVDPRKDHITNLDILEDIIGPEKLTGLKVRWYKEGESGSVYREIDVPVYDYPFDSWRKYPVYRSQACIPANTFDINSNIVWQWQAQINNNWSQNPNWRTTSTIDAMSASSLIAPVNVTFDVESELEFSWTHVIATGSDPTGYDIQYSTNGSTWIDLKSDHQTGDTSCIIPANSLPAGKLWWRVRTYNGDYLPGAWSDPANIVGYGAPPAPIISSVTTGARPTIRWQSETQVAYALVIKQDNTQILTVNETASTDKYYTVRDYLADGSYTVRVRIKNAGAYWSSWAEQDFRVQTQKPVAPTLTAEPIKNGIQFYADMGSEAATVYLLRDGVPIGLMDSGGYRDYGTVGPHTYTARRIGDDDSFADSKPLLAVTEVRQAVIAPADDLGSMVGPLLQVESNTYPSSVTNGATLVHYAGRRYPVAVTTDAIAEEYNPVFAAYGLAQYNALYAYMLDGRTVLYRNSTGDCAYCIITEMSPTKSYRGVTRWQMTLARVDYIDRIDYRVGGVNGPSTGRLYR